MRLLIFNWRFRWFHQKWQSSNSLYQETKEVTEAEKLAARAKRWGLPEKPEEAGDETEKLAARAKRWGLEAEVEAGAAAEDAEKLAARAKRCKNQTRIVMVLQVEIV